MHGLLKLGIELIEAMFFAGLAGSALVIIIVSVEDMAVLLDKAEDNARPE